MNRDFSNTKIALIGCGKWGQNLARILSQKNILAGIVTTGAETAIRQAQRFGTHARSCEDVLSDPRISAIFIATPSQFHAEYGLKALQAGKHIFVEKPFALNVRDAERMEQLAKTNGLIAMAGHVLLYHPAFVALKDRVQSGEMGRILSIFSQRYKQKNLPYRDDICWNLAPHDVSMILALGVSEEPKISCIKISSRQRREIAEMHLKLEFKDAVSADIHLSYQNDTDVSRFICICERGVAIFDDRREWPKKLQLIALDSSLLSHHDIVLTDEFQGQYNNTGFVNLPEVEPLAAECQDFLECISTGRKPKSTTANAISTIRILEKWNMNYTAGNDGQK